MEDKEAGWKDYGRLMAQRRTRFLADLDEMIRTDKRGAIADMLQVLREAGGIVDYHSLRKVQNPMLRDPEHRHSIEQDTAHMLVAYLVTQGVIQFRTQALEDDESMSVRDASEMMSTIYAVPKEYLHVKGDPRENN